MRLIADKRGRSRPTGLAQRDRRTGARFAGAYDHDPSRITTFSGKVDEHFSVFQLHLVGLEVHANWSALCRACAIVEPSIVLRAFDNVIHDESVREMYLLVGTKAIRRVVSIIWRPEDRKGSSAVIELDDVLLINRAHAANFNPSRHSLLLQFSTHGVQRAAPSS